MSKLPTSFPSLVKSFLCLHLLSINSFLFVACSHKPTWGSREGKGGGRAVPHHVGIRVWDDVGREIVGVHLLAEGCELLCGIDRSNWKVLTCDRKTRHTHRHILLSENGVEGATSLSLGRLGLGMLGWHGRMGQQLML